MIDEKKIQIISYLLHQTTWVTTNTLANIVSVSPRSISNYINEINAAYEDLIYSTNKGYRVHKDYAVEIINSWPVQNIPADYEGRKVYILYKILLSRQQITLDSLCEKFCISILTLQNEIAKLRTELTECNLHLRIKEDRLSIIGPDRDKRKLINKLINQEVERSSFSIEGIQKLFLNVNLKEIREIVLDALRDHEYFLDQYSLLNYIIHLAVFLELHQNTNAKNKATQEQKKILQDFATPHVHKMIEEIYQKLVNISDFEFSIDEIYQISLLMMTRAVPNRLSHMPEHQISELVGEEIEQLVQEIVNAVRETYSIELGNNNFIVGFAFHLKNVIARAENNLTITNQQLKKIKHDFPFIYVIAVFISDYINKKENFNLSEDEIAYIALHIGVMMEGNKAYSEKLRCVILAPNFYNGFRTLYKKINTVFSESLFLTNVVSAYDDLPDMEDYDLLLSTIEIRPKCILPYEVIDPFLSEASIKRVFLKIDEIKQILMKQKVVDQFKFFFREDLFFYNKPFKNHEDAIEEICDYMMEHEYVDKSYKKEIYEHEDISPSAYGNIAIPHPLSNSAKSSVIAISINPNPIQWGNNEVNIVFMLSIQEEKRYLFKDIFEFITMLMAKDEFLAKIVNTKTFDDFITLLVSYY